MNHIDEGPRDQSQARERESRLDPVGFLSVASNGSGDPFGVAPETARVNAPGSILHLNHDTGGFAVIAPDLSSFLIGLGNYGECWHPESEASEVVAGRRLQERLETLGWPAELRRSGQA